jgi:hypothetical protein
MAEENENNTSKRNLILSMFGPADISISGSMPGRHPMFGPSPVVDSEEDDNEVEKDDFVSSIPGLKEKLTSVSKNYDPKKPYVMQDLFLKVEQADPIHTSTFAVGKDALNISIPTENIKPEVLVNTTIRPISDAELSMEEDEAIEAYKKSYGHLGFTFKTSGFGFDYVTIKHKNDTGKGITVSHDQWYFISESDKKEFNDYLGKYSKNLTQEQIDKTHNLSKHAQDIINIKSGVKTPEDLKK